MLEFYNDNTYKAKKEYTCEFCNQKIYAGEKYHRQSGKYDGEFFDRKLHTTCNNMISEYCKEEQEYEEISYDAVIEWITDKYCYGCFAEDDCVVSIFRCNLIADNYKEVLNAK